MITSDVKADPGVLALDVAGGAGDAGDVGGVGDTGGAGDENSVMQDTR